MNFIILQVDTLRYDYLECQGNKAKTPNFNRLAKKSWVFERCYSGSYPSAPQRHDCVTGRYVFPFYGWQNLPDDEIVLTQFLTKSGYETYHVSDAIMFVGWKDIRGFNSWKILSRKMASREEIEKTPPPCSPEKSRCPSWQQERWAAYIHKLEKEIDWGSPKVMMHAADWLRNRDKNKPFFIWMETWEVHEPWLPPRDYIDIYDPNYEGEEVAFPGYGISDYLTPSELKHSQAMYAGAVTFVDKWFGKFMETVEDLNLLDDTVIVVTSDHGYSLGDHSRIGKHAVHGESAWCSSAWPLYEECARVPLIVHVPGQAYEKRSQALVQHVDILPTALELAEIKIPNTARKRVTGCSWVPILEEKTNEVRNIAYTNSGLRVWRDSVDEPARVTLTSPKWAMILSSPDQPTELYNLESDPNQKLNVYKSNLDVAQTLHKSFINFLESVGTNPEKVESWRKHCKS